MFDWVKRRWTHALVMLIVIVLAAGLAFSFPPDMAFLFAIDLSTWVEAAIAVYVTAQAGRIRPLIAFLRAKLFVRPRSSARQVRSRSERRPEPTNDEDAPPAQALAA